MKNEKFCKKTQIGQKGISRYHIITLKMMEIFIFMLYFLYFLVNIQFIIAVLIKKIKILSI